MRTLSKDAVRSLLDVLEVLSARDHEAELVERFYDLFFEQNPEVVPLFGKHAIAEREEMIQETLKSLLAYCDGETWLETNLRALGKSHAEYGVETTMYPAYVAAFLETLRDVLGDRLSPETVKHVGEALEEICGVMSEAGEASV